MYVKVSSKKPENHHNRTPNGVQNKHAKLREIAWALGRGQETHCPGNDWISVLKRLGDVLKSKFRREVREGILQLSVVSMQARMQATAVT